MGYSLSSVEREPFAVVDDMFTGSNLVGIVEDIARRAYAKGFKEGLTAGIVATSEQVEKVLEAPDKRQQALDPRDRLVYIANVRSALSEVR